MPILLLLLLVSIFSLAQYPNPKLTPGAVRTTSQKDICNKHFRTTDERHTTDKLKNQIYKEYEITPHQGVCKDVSRYIKTKMHYVKESCEVDHLVSLELGGADTKENLWIQIYNRSDGWDAHRKDKLETRLHKLVCTDHAMSLVQAQQCIQSDWIHCYKTIF